MDIDSAMAEGATIYADALAVLEDVGWKAFFTQTGGMCGAIEVTLERGHVLITDMSDSLPWDRSQLAGWGVGYYPEEGSDGPVAYMESEDAASCLPQLLRECLVAGSGRRGLIS